MWGEAATAVGLRNKQPADSVRFSDVHNRCFSLSARTRTANVPFRITLLSSAPCLQHIVDPTLLPTPEIIPVPAYEHVPAELAARYFGYPHASCDSNLKIWMAFQILFAHLEVDIGVRHFAGCWISLLLSSLVGDPRQRDVEVVVGNVGDEVTWYAWLFDENQNEPQVAVENHADTDWRITFYIIIFPIMLVGFMMSTETAAFRTVVRGIIEFVSGYWIFTFLPGWARVLLLLFSLVSFITHGLMQQIVDWTRNGVKNYVRNKFTKLYNSLLGRPTPFQPLTFGGALLHIHDSWMTNISATATQLVQLFPPTLHIGVVTVVTFILRVLLGFYSIATVLFLCYLLLRMFIG
ncbi:hypothetical protein ACLB2K_051440 [Fragaria x ananassa]